MKKDKKIDLLELEDDDLDEVMGGIINSRVDNCPYFLKANDKRNENNCDNCFYYHAIERLCTSPIKNK